jgi:hypothetical protein
MFSASNRQGLYYKAESVWGETPSGGAFTQLRYTGETLDRAKNTAPSEVIREDRMVDELALLGYDVSGDINYELAYGVFDPFLEALLCGTWVTIDHYTVPTISITVAAAGKTFTRAAGSFVSDGVVPGCFVKFTGFTNGGNNGEFLVASVTATVITVVDPTAALVDEAGSGNEGYYTAFCVNGVVDSRSFAIEKRWTDIAKFQWFNGLRASQMDMDLTAMQIIKGKFAFMGKDAVASSSTVAGSSVAASISKLMSASANVASITLNGTSLTTGIKSMKFTLDNGLRKQDIVGSQATGGIGYGGFSVKGSLEAYFEDLVMLNHVINHDDCAVTFKTPDADGNRYYWNAPKLKFTKGNPKAAGKNQDITIPIEFEAIRDSVTNSMIIITRIPSTIV